MSQIIVNEPRQRLHCVYPDGSNEASEREDNQDFTIDIVALHGLNGHWKWSWTSASSGFFWLRDALPATCPFARILSYSWDGSPETAVEGLMWDLINDRLECSPERPCTPILLIGNSFGGTLAKQLYLSSSPSRNSNEQVHRLHEAIKGFVFLGTRHHGQHRTGLTIPSYILRTLSTKLNSVANAIEQTPRINRDFRMLGGEKLPLTCFYETEPVNYLGIIVPKEDAIITPSDPNNTICMPLDASHQNMGKFERNDQNYKRVLSSIRNLTMTIRDSFRVEANTAEARQRLDTQHLNPPGISEEEFSSTRVSSLRILSLDGGGVRGLFTIMVLEELMEEVRKIDRPESSDAIRPCEYFDIIAGTSTGGLLAIMLGRLRMDIISCKEAYTSLSAKIFKTGWQYPGQQLVDAWRGKSWFSGEALQQAVQEIILSRISPRELNELAIRGILVQDAPLRPQTISTTKTFVCAIVDDSHECARLRTYGSQTGETAQPCSIWQACRATSAAPFYFPAAIIGDHKYFDGGMNSNNPILEAVEESYLEYPGTSFNAIVSIGTGKGVGSAPGPTAGNVMKSILHRLTNTEAKHNEFLRRFPSLTDTYFRLNDESDLHKIDLADWKAMDRIEKFANDYIASSRGRDCIQMCARKLARAQLLDVAQQ